jgi:hypothetical protein
MISDAKTVVKYLIVCQIMYITGLTLAKCSIMACYLRIFPGETFRKSIYITGFVIFAIWICGVLITIFQCSPVHAAWDFTLTHKKCVDIIRFYFVTAGLTIATDLLLCTLPLPKFWSLNLPLKERIIVCVLFGFGFLYVIIQLPRYMADHSFQRHSGQHNTTHSVTQPQWTRCYL